MVVVTGSVRCWREVGLRFLIHNKPWRRYAAQNTHVPLRERERERERERVDACSFRPALTCTLFCRKSRSQQGIEHKPLQSFTLHFRNPMFVRLLATHRERSLNMECSEHPVLSLLAYSSCWISLFLKTKQQGNAKCDSMNTNKLSPSKSHAIPRLCSWYFIISFSCSIKASTSCRLGRLADYFF